MCLVWMMPNSTLRHAFNQCYASLLLPRWSFLSPMEATIKNMDSVVTWPSKQPKNVWGHKYQTIQPNNMWGHKYQTDVFNFLRWEVVAHFADICGNVDHHLIKLSFHNVRVNKSRNNLKSLTASVWTGWTANSRAARKLVNSLINSVHILE